MMNTLYEKLNNLKNPIKVGVAGAGEFSAEMITQISYINNMEVSVIGDLNPEAAINQQVTVKMI